VTAPITNSHFQARVVELTRTHLAEVKAALDRGDAPADPIVPPLTPTDTSLFPSGVVSTYIAYTSPWIDLASSDPAIASISRQVLNLEVAYANFCGVRSVVIPGPRRDASRTGGNRGLAQYARAVQEALTIASRLSFMVHIPMYREPGLEEDAETLSDLFLDAETPSSTGAEIDIYSAWDSWHVIRTICSYDLRLFVGKSLLDPPLILASSNS
jgi:type II protein arginine methyltransferase